MFDWFMLVISLLFLIGYSRVMWVYATMEEIFQSLRKKPNPLWWWVSLISTVFFIDKIFL